MTPDTEALRVAMDRSLGESDRVSALKGLVESTNQDVLDGVTVVAEDATESDQVAYEAGWTLARLHALRGSLDDVSWSNFSHGADHGFSILAPRFEVSTR